MLIGLKGLKMKWFSTMITLVFAAAVVATPGSFVHAKSSKPSKKPSSQNVTLDEIELDSDEPEVSKPEAKSGKSPGAKAASDVTQPVVESKPVPKAVQEAITKARSLEEKKQYTDVVAALKPVVDQLPRHGILMLSRAYRATNNLSGELQMLEILLAKNPKDYVVKTQEADVLVKLNRMEEALASYQAAKALNKQYKPAYDGHWKALEKAKDMYEARAVLSDMVKVFGPTPSSQSQLCRLFSTEDFLEKSEENCRKAIELDPKNPDNYVHLGLSLRDQERADDATKLLVDAAKRFPASESVLSAAADLKAAKKDFGDSYELYKKATVADSTSVRSWLGLAKSAHELQKYPEAIEAFTKSCLLDRKTSIHFRSAMTTLKQTGNPAMAAKYLDAEERCH
jgi:tetratricopeptide (TPR) repeat protein